MGILHLFSYFFMQNIIESFVSDAFSHTFLLWSKFLIVVLFVAVALFFTKRLVSRLQVTISEHNNYEENAISFGNIVGDVIFYLMLIVSAYIWLQIVWFESTYIALWATFATGYAFKELFQNLVSWILIMTTKEFVLGDIIEVYIDDSIYFWRIDMITIRYTVVRKLDMTRVVIPNRLLTRVPVLTFSAEENIRLQTSFKITTHNDMRTLTRSLKDLVMGLESVTEKEATIISLEAIDEWLFLITIFFYFDPKAGKLRFRVISEVNMAVSEFFKEQHISFAYPHTTVTFDYHDSSLIRGLQLYNTYA